ncbi:MAG: polysaccharide biosynthesis C-terminal domain-containing protein [Nitrospinota bacterium]|nr:polysaccharide biosynthesis C-terminal domain-containing protein [Nitrospinota bacterium]
MLQRFIVNLSWNVAGKICSQIALFAISVLLARYLGRDRLGIYASILVIPTFVRLLNSFGLETVLNKNFPKLQAIDRTRQQGRHLLKSLVALRILSMLVFCGLLYLLLPFYFQWVYMPQWITYRPVIIFYFAAITCNSLLSTLFMALLRYKVTSILETINGILNLVLLVVFIKLDWGIFAVLYAYIIATALVVTVYCFLAAPYITGPAKKMEKDDSVQLAWAAYIVSLFSFGLMTQSDVVLMNYFQVDTVHISYYHLATGIGGMLIFVLVGIGPMALSIFSETFAKESYPGLSRVWSQIVGFTIICAAPVYLFAMFNAEGLITFIYGDQFLAAGNTLSIYLVFVLAGTAMGSGFAASTLFVLGKRDVPLRATVEGGILNIILNLLLIPLYQEIGAILATGLIMVYIAIRQLFHIHRNLDIHTLFPLVGKYLFLALVALAPAELVARVWVDHLFSNLAVYTATVLGLLAWIKPVSREQAKLVTDIYPTMDHGLKYFVR